jgi:hypothetical protein
VPCDHCLWRRMRPGFCDSAADLPIVPTNSGQRPKADT